MGYTGNQYRTPLVGGLTKNSNQTQRRPYDLDEATNITLHENNIQRDFGEANISSVLSGIPRAGLDYFPIPTLQKTVIYTSDGKLQIADDQGAGAFTDLYTGLDGTKVGQFVLGGQEIASNNRKLFFFNGNDIAQVLEGNGTSTERIGFLAELTNALSTDTGGGSGYPSTAVKVDYTNHLLETGNNISLVGFSNVGGIDPNVENVSITKLDDDSFYYTPAANPSATESSGGGTGKVYAQPADWQSTVQPIGGVVHEKRLATFLRHTVYLSTISDHSQFERGDVFDLPVFTSLGNQIVGGESLFGRLIIFKYPRGIIQIVNPTAQFPDIKVLSTALGTVGQNSFKEVEGDVVFISQFGSIHSLLAVDSVDEIRSSSITGRFYLDRFIRDNVNFAQIQKATLEYDSTNRVVWAVYPKIGSTENDFVIKVDVNEPGNPKVSVTQRNTYVSLWQQQDANSQFRLVAGTQDQYIRNLNSTNRQNFDGTAFESKWRTSFTDFSDQVPQVQGLNKQCDFLEFVLEPDGTDVDATIHVYSDGTIRDTVSVSFRSVAPNFPFSFPVTFNSDLPRNFSFPIRGCYGRRIAAEFIINSLNQNFKVSDIIYRFRLGDEKNLG